MLLYHVCEDKCCASALAFNWLHKQLAALRQAFLDETVCRSIMLLWIFLDVIVYLDIQVFEVFWTLGVGLAGNVQDVGHSNVDQLLCFECRLERTHVDAVLNLNQLDVLDGLPTVYIACALWHVGESSADHVLFLRIECSSCLFEFGAWLNSIQGGSLGHVSHSGFFHHFLNCFN